MLARNPMGDEEQRVQGRQIQGGPTLQKKPGLGQQVGTAVKNKFLSSAMTPGGLVGTAAVDGGAAATQGLLGAGGTISPSLGTIGTTISGALAPAATTSAITAAAPTALSAAIPAVTTSVLPTAATSLAAPLATGATAAAGGLAAMAPLLAAAGPFALMALPFLLNDGTNKVPDVDYGPDPFAQGYNNGTPGIGLATEFLGRHPMGGVASQVPGIQAAQQLAAQHPMGNVVSQLPFGKALGLNDGTTCVGGVNCDCPSCKARKYNNGTQGVQPTTNMNYAGGTDSVPAMLTPGEAIIPAAAAQNPANKPMIDSMVNEGRAANDMAQGGPLRTQTYGGPMSLPEASPVTTSNIGSLQSPSLGQQPSDFPSAHMSGPLSGKAKREQMKLLQDMSFKKKSFEAEEARKQQAFEEKMSQNRSKSMMSLQQSQE